MQHSHPRVNREEITMGAMIKIFCQGNHTATNALCPSCQDLLNYAEDRLDRCIFREGKPTCAKCPIHCYHPERRAEVRKVMRYAGPRMIYHHPILALMHFADGLKSSQESKLPKN
jgi:predicted amidophosphoribosyltransferase